MSHPMPFQVWKNQLPHKIEDSLEVEPSSKCLQLYKVLMDKKEF